MKEEVVKTNKIACYFQIKKEAIEKNKIADYFKIKKEIESANGDIFKITFIY